LQEQGQLCYRLSHLHAGEIALEEDGALRPLCALVVQGIGGADDFILWLHSIFLFHSRYGRCSGGHGERVVAVLSLNHARRLSGGMLLGALRAVIHIFMWV
jgi:hypothetical protein